jgi:mannitol/fructose-specific phosphotransferase system IIA component (Ntr-type)
MILGRMLKPELIRMELQTMRPEEPEEPYDRQRFLWSIKETALDELTGLVALSGRIGNANRLRCDLINREKKATTGLANGVAVPHVRTREAREFIVAFARSTPGLEFDCLDGNLAHLFIVLVAPPYDDVQYLRIYKQLAEAFVNKDAARILMEAADEGEVIRAFKEL